MIKKIYLLLFFLAPFGYYFNRYFESNFNLTFNFLFIIVTLIIFLTQISKIKKVEIHSIFKASLIVLPLTLGLLWTPEISRGLFFIIVCYSIILTTFNLYKLNLQEKSWGAFSLGVFLFSIFFVFDFISTSSEYAFDGTRLGYVTSDVYYLDPNWLAYWCVITIFYFFTNIVKKRYLLTNFLIIIFLFYIILSTQSRSAMFAMVIVLIIYIFLKKKYILGIFSALIIILFTFVYLLIDVNSRLFSEGLRNNVRSELNLASWQAIFDSVKTFFIGYGTGAGDRAIGLFYDAAIFMDDNIYRYNNHNTYLDILLQVGLLGFLLLLFIIVISLVLIKKFRFQLPLVTTMFLFIVVQAFVYNPIKNGILMISLSIVLSYYMKFIFDIKSQNQGSTSELKNKRGEIY